MTSPRLAIIGLILIALAIVVYLIIGRQSAQDAGNGTHGPMVVAPAIAPAATITVPPMPQTTGDYAGDWQSKCGPIADPKAQAHCTAALDAAYGRQAGVAIPDSPAPASGK